MHIHQVIIGGVAALVLLFAGYTHWHTNQQPTDRLPTSREVAKKTQGVSAQSGDSSKICIDIKGAVNRPGVYHLLKGSRVEEAIRAAGGSTDQSDLNQVNLAKELMDQQIVQIPKLGEQLTSNVAAGGADAGSTDGEKINLNNATKEDLMKIDGVGEKKAEKILEYRNQHGGFKSPDDLKNISGFGDKTVAKLKDRLAV